MRLDINSWLQSRRGRSRETKCGRPVGGWLLACVVMGVYMYFFPWRSIRKVGVKWDNYIKSHGLCVELMIMDENNTGCVLRSVLHAWLNVMDVFSRGISHYLTRTPCYALVTTYMHILITFYFYDDVLYSRDVPARHQATWVMETGGEEKERGLREDEIRKKGGERKKRGEEAEDGRKKIGWRPKREKKKIERRQKKKRKKDDATTMWIIVIRRSKQKVKIRRQKQT